MPSLSISFPEKETPSVVVLRGRHITVGRLPQNTIQIRDRTISAYHAELIEEEGHYRLHDVGATNGLLVNGEPVTDFHLEEACKVTFGGVECEFSPETPAEKEVDPSLALLTRGESEVLVARNVDLEKDVASLREQLAEIQKAGEAEAATEVQRLAAELNTIKESLAAREREAQQLKSDFAVLHRDRVNLQRALNESKAKPAEAPAAEPSKPSFPAARPAAVPVPAAAPAPAANAPVAKPVTPLPKPSLPKPATPLPHAVPTPVAASAKPALKPQPAPGNGNGIPSAQPRPATFTKSPAGSSNPQAAPKPSLATRPPTAVSGPKGTQKIDT